MTNLDKEADAIVREMIGLGAQFETSRSPRGETWHYAARPSMREPLRRYKATLDLTKIGMNDAMVRAVVRAKTQIR